jgi:formylglycine-generating enzyme
MLDARPFSPSRPLLARCHGLWAAGYALGLFVSGCGSETTLETTPREAALVEAASLPASIQSSSAPAPEPADDPAPGEDDGPCGPAMELVAGDYCITPEQRCVLYQDIPSEGGKIIPNQCLRYAEPVTCFRDRKKMMRFCMDRFEWPNKKGELPRTLISWRDARALCESEGKRLCTEEEFNFACEGEAMKPFVYGYSRDPSKCNFDRPYRPRTYTFLPSDACAANAECRAAYEAIDQRVPSGSMGACRSADGVYDLNGNVNEWVVIPGAKKPRRSGIKGGWWGPVRDRCRPTVTFHDEADFGYEVGFRCCADAPLNP